MPILCSHDIRAKLLQALDHTPHMPSCPFCVSKVKVYESGAHKNSGSCGKYRRLPDGTLET